MTMRPTLLLGLRSGALPQPSTHPRLQRRKIPLPTPQGARGPLSHPTDGAVMQHQPKPEPAPAWAGTVGVSRTVSPSNHSEWMRAEVGLRLHMLPVAYSNKLCNGHVRHL